MFADVTLNVLIAVVMTVLAYFGIAADERRRWRIGILCVVGLALISYQALRSASSQQQLTKQIGDLHGRVGQLNGQIGSLKDNIRELEGKLPKPHVPTAALRISDVNVIQMGNDQPVKVNVHLQNNGDATAEGNLYVTRFKFVKSSPDAPAEDAVFGEIKRAMALSTDTGSSIAAGSKIFFTVTGPVLHKEDFVPPNSREPQVIRNGEVLILAGRIRYRSSHDKTVPDKDTEFCMFIMNPKVLIMCKGHNH